MNGGCEKWLDNLAQAVYTGSANGEMPTLAIEYRKLQRQAGLALLVTGLIGATID
jgi:hypothetical protein